MWNLLHLFAQAANILTATCKHLSVNHLGTKTPLPKIKPLDRAIVLGKSLRHNEKIPRDNLDIKLAAIFCFEFYSFKGKTKARVWGELKS